MKGSQPSAVDLEFVILTPLLSSGPFGSECNGPGLIYG
jgi:hypothetical protein